MNHAFWKNAARRLVCGALTLALLGTQAVAALALDRPSNESPGGPGIVDSVDDTGAHVTDLLAVTPYLRKNDMLQDYKARQFDLAVGALGEDRSSSILPEALQSTLLPGMNPEKLTIKSLYFIHEVLDSGIVKLPVTITISCDLPLHAYCRIIQYKPNSLSRSSAAGGGAGLRLLTAGPGVQLGSWTPIPSVRNADGSITFTAEEYGAYATVTYITDESEAGSSPQTGDRTYAAQLVLLAAAAAAVLCALPRQEDAL